MSFIDPFDHPDPYPNTKSAGGYLAWGNRRGPGLQSQGKVSFATMDKTNDEQNKTQDLKPIIKNTIKVTGLSKVKGITSTEIDGDGHLIIHYTDHTQADVGLVVGADGADGMSATCDVGTTTEGYPPAVVNVGDTTNAVFDFTLPGQSYVDDRIADYFAGHSYIQDAPVDGTKYCRKDGAWVAV